MCIYISQYMSIHGIILGLITQGFNIYWGIGLTVLVVFSIPLIVDWNSRIQFMVRGSLIMTVCGQFETVSCAKTLEKEHTCVHTYIHTYPLAGLQGLCTLLCFSSMFLFCGQFYRILTVLKYVSILVILTLIIISPHLSVHAEVKQPGPVKDSPLKSITKIIYWFFLSAPTAF